MNTDSKGSLWISRLLPLFVTVAFIKLGWVLIKILMLPSEGVDLSRTQAGKSLFLPYKLASNEALKPPVKSQPKVRKRDLIKEMKLRGLYQDDRRSIAVISKGNKSYLVSPGERILGYRLDSIETDAALLSKEGKHYRLELSTPQKGSTPSPLSSSGTSERKTSPSSAPSTAKEEEAGTRTISRETLSKYTADLDTIRKYIGVVPYKKDGTLKGFKVRYIRRGSDFEKLGLRRGDVITGINGEEITDLSVPMELMHNLETVEGLTLQIKRGDKELELDYEIR